MYIDYKNDYHLTIEANIERDLTPNENGVKIITPIILLERLQRFKNCLFDIVKTMHQVSINKAKKENLFKLI